MFITRRNSNIERFAQSFIENEKNTHIVHMFISTLSTIDGAQNNLFFTAKLRIVNKCEIHYFVFATQYVRVEI